MNFINQVLKDFKKKFFHILKTIFGALIWQVCNHLANITKESNIYVCNLDSSNRSKAKSKRCEPNKIWVDQGSEFCNNSFKDFFEDK